MGRPKRRGNGDGSIYHDGQSWMAALTLPNGKTARRRAPTERAAREKLKHLLAEHQQGVDLTKKQLTVSEWCGIWLNEFATNLKPNIAEDYASVVRTHISGTFIGAVRLDKLTPAQVQAWVNALAKQRSAKTTRNAHARLHRALGVAVRLGYISRNPARGVELPPHRATEITPLDFGQAAALLDALADHRLYALYRLALNTGARQAELTGLTWACIDLKAKTLTIKQQLQRAGGAWHLQTTKTKSGTRTLTLDDDLCALLRTHRATQAEERLLLGPNWRDPFAQQGGGLVFTTSTGGPLHMTSITTPLKRALKAAGLPAIRFHDLRHTAATLMLDGGVPLVTVSKVLGHSSPSVTASVYAHALDESKANAIANLSARLRRA
jgi:integrase